MRKNKRGIQTGKKATAVKPITGFPLEVLFTESGYKLTWDSRFRMQVAEYRFFCDYFKDRYAALLYFGTMQAQTFSGSSASLRLIYSLSSNFLRAAAACSDIDALKLSVQSKLEKMKPKLIESQRLSYESVSAIYTGLIEKLRELSMGMELSKCVESIYARSVAQCSVRFSIEEVANSPEYPFRLLVTAVYGGRDIPLREACARLGEGALSDVSYGIKQAARTSALIKNVYNEGQVLDSYALSQDDMYTFLKEMEMYARYGIGCRIPNKWKKQKSSLSINIALGRHRTQIGVDAIMDFDINLSLGGEKLSPDEIQALLENDDELFVFRGKWVELNKSEMRSCLAAYESILNSHDDGSIALADAMRAFLAPETLLPDEFDDDFATPLVTLDNAGLMEQLASKEGEILFDVNEPSESFTAKLRPYQRDGVRWLNIMRAMGLGACLSDDMGLGKTVQAIAVLEQIRHQPHGQSLIVIPASLIQNWQDELKRFAPNIKFRLLHSSYGNMRITEGEDTDVYITTYTMLSRLPQLKKIEWECIILDEAQAIKNPQTLQSKSAKLLKARFRIAMTGTPIENSITDLWSIFDFLNPQLFGGGIDFPGDDSDAISEKLRNFVRPFILRRLKTDKSIISDLPEKIEMKSYCHLTQRQAVLYKQITNALSDEISYMHGMERRGLVLSSILKLKQICNHPDQYTGYGAYLQGESGKMLRLVDICNDIKERHERVLVFTQFKEMCEPLYNTLRDVFEADGLIIHGSVSVSERGKIVERFNNPDEYIPFIVLSLRAGGVGLNLTAANHVIHFDRWWNPAVENQATDRAFRIGQMNNVIVHKLICTGTLEEKIDKLIERKSDMAMDIVENDVKLTELSNEELLSLLHMEE